MSWRIFCGAISVIIGRIVQVCFLQHERNGDEESEWWNFEPRKHRKHIGIKEKA
jgi:hypothetical protein